MKSLSRKIESYFSYFEKVGSFMNINAQKFQPFYFNKIIAREKERERNLSAC